MGGAFSTHGIKAIRTDLVENPTGKRPLSRTKPRWDEYIEMYLKEQDGMGRDKRQAQVNMKINLQVAYNAWNTFTSTGNIKILNQGSFH